MLGDGSGNRGADRDAARADDLKSALPDERCTRRPAFVDDLAAAAEDCGVLVQAGDFLAAAGADYGAVRLAPQLNDLDGAASNVLCAFDVGPEYDAAGTDDLLTETERRV